MTQVVQKMPDLIYFPILICASMGALISGLNLFFITKRPKAPNKKWKEMLYSGILSFS